MAKTVVVAQYESGNIFGVYKNLKRARKILHAFTFHHVDEFGSVDVWQGTAPNERPVTLEVHALT